MSMQEVVPPLSPVELTPAQHRRHAWTERPAGAAPTWQKGQSGNPTGKSGLYQQCVKACRADSPNNIETLKHLRDNSDDDRVRYMAATYLHERAWGKAPQFDPKADGDTVPVFDPSKMSPAQLAQIKAAMTLLVQAMTAVEVEIEPQE